MRNRPLLTAGALALGFGLAMGLWYVQRSRRLKADQKHAGAPARTAEAVISSSKRLAGKIPSREIVELVPLAVKLLENPLVRGLLVSAATRAVVRRLR